jgi:hypothetical protein
MLNRQIPNSISLCGLKGETEALGAGWQGEASRGFCPHSSHPAFCLQQSFWPEPPLQGQPSSLAPAALPACGPWCWVGHRAMEATTQGAAWSLGRCCDTWHLPFSATP